MSAPLGELSLERFLADYWQQRPCLIRQAFPDFDPLLEPDDLAGLACEPLADARLVEGSHPGGGWKLRHGPFEESVFDTLGERAWTLLVQDVEKHYPPLREVTARFGFIPGWRHDDLMVSFAAPGGSVGPHVDQYDVFLLQAQGRRRWEIAVEFDPRWLEDCPLEVLARFEPEEGWDLEAGDLLYLPPGVAHHGVALEPCLTYSIGLRAPAAADLLQALGEHLAGTQDGGERYRDPPGFATARPGELDPAAIEAFRSLLSRTLADNGLAPWLAAFLSRERLALEPEAPPRPPSAERIRRALQAGGGLERHPWTRLVWIARDGAALLHATGEPYVCSTALASALCAPEGPRADPADWNEVDWGCVVELVQAGHLLLSVNEE